jgi:hypothetical protein
MFASSKASRVGFVAIVVALSSVLGGCAESVSGVPASTDAEEVTSMRYYRNDRPHLQPQVDVVASKPEAIPEPRKIALKHSLHTSAVVR